MLFEGVGGINFIQRIDDLGEIAGGDACVDLGGPGARVSKELLDVAEVDSLFQEVGGEAVTEGVWGGMLVDARFFQGPFENVLDAGRAVLLASWALE